ncbi:unnamed protein product [Peniophora sp. CBMAI 1063]|nr:unnamed protein product [Peniophora sp. CBMAI 1063]
MGRQQVSTTNTKNPELRTFSSIPNKSTTTPNRHSLSGSSRWGLFGHENAATTYNKLSSEMRDSYVGNMPLEVLFGQILTASVPRDKTLHPDMDFTEVWTSVDATDNHIITYNPRTTLIMAKVINESGICPHIHFASTENCHLDQAGPLAPGDGLERRKVDLSGLYVSDPQQPHKTAPDFATMRLPIELKRKIEDIVVNGNAKWTSAQRKQQGLPHQTAPAIHARGQSSSYALNQQQQQALTQSWSMVIAGETARILIFDHSGVIVTESFDWKTGSVFTEFLWRLERASAEVVGLDDSVVEGPLSESVESAARAAFEDLNKRDCAPYKVTPDEPLRTVRVWDEGEMVDGEPKVREYVATYPVELPPSLVSRWTVGYLAYDIATRAVHWIKDSWRLAVPEFDKEGLTYQRLKEAGVPNLPVVVSAGDVRWKSGVVQTTRAHQYTGADWAHLTQNVNPLVHYRIVFATIGKPLLRFNSFKHFCELLLEALKAHAVAYEKAKILHRDISTGNILIDEHGHALLIDWDLCMDITKAAARRPWRTGTWQFISAALLSLPTVKAHQLRDDLESFYWVLLYVVLRYRYIPSKYVEDSDRHRRYMSLLFDFVEKSGPLSRGGFRKQHYLKKTGEHLSDADFDEMKDADGAEIPAALPWLLATLRDDLAKLYVETSPERKPSLKRKAPSQATNVPPPAGGTTGPPPSAPVVMGPFDSSDYIISVFTEALEEGDWRDDDSACDRFKDLSPPRRARLRLQDIALPPPVILNASVSNPELLHRKHELDATLTLEEHEKSIENKRATRAVAQERLATIEEDGDFHPHPIVRHLPRTPKRRRLEDNRAGYAFSAAASLDLSGRRSTSPSEDALPMPPRPPKDWYP